MKEIKQFKVLFRYLKNNLFSVILYIFFNILVHFEPLVNAFLWANAFEQITSGNFSKFTLYLMCWSGVIIFAWVILQLPTALLYNKIEKDFIENVNMDLYKKINDLPAIAFEEKTTGEYVNRLSTDPERILELLNKLIKLSCRLVIAIIIVFVAFSVSLLVGIELLILAICMYLLANVYYPKIKKEQEAVKEKSDEYIKRVTQNISGIREIKSLGIKNNINNQINNVLNSLFNRQRKIGKTESWYYAINNLIYFVLQFLILYTLGYQYFKEIITLASFIVIEKYIWRIDDVVESLSEFGISYNKVIVSLKRIGEILDNKLYDDEKFGNKEIKEEKVSITFNNVYIKYRNKEGNILKGLNMEFKPNMKTAIVGKSGSGKSTIFNILSRFFDATKGVVKVNDIDIKDLSEESLRNTISIVRQNPFLFNTSILDNFKVVDPSITLKQVRDACKKAYIDDYIMGLPNKYDTIIGEGGVNLSGGQKQRIAIARTLIKDTKVILFDEATSALDNKSQEYIKKVIDNLAKDHTIIIVAHRLSTIMDADLIYILEDGKVVDKGCHDTLIKTCDVYKELYNPEIIGE